MQIHTTDTTRRGNMDALTSQCAVDRSAYVRIISVIEHACFYTLSNSHATWLLLRIVGKKIWWCSSCQNRMFLHRWWSWVWLSYFHCILSRFMTLFCKLFQTCFVVFCEFEYRMNWWLFNFQIVLVCIVAALIDITAAAIAFVVLVVFGGYFVEAVVAVVGGDVVWLLR